MRLGERVTGLWTTAVTSAGTGGASWGARLSRERFHSWPGWQRRAAKVGLAGVLAFLLSLFVNTLEHFFGQVAAARS